MSSGQTQDGNGTRVHLNIDPGQRALAIDLDGVLAFEQRAPRFDGAVTFAAPAVKTDPANLPWRIMAKVKADQAAARLDQIEVSYGPEERALRLTGAGEASFGAAPRLRASLSARQLDADRFAARDNNEPVRAWPAVRALLSGTPHLPMPSQIEILSDQIMLGGRPVQDVAAEFHGDGKTWSVRKLDFRAPGTTRVSLTRRAGAGRGERQFQGRVQCRVRRSRRAHHLAAGPQRSRLSQPEAAAAARRRHHRAERLFASTA